MLCDYFTVQGIINNGDVVAVKKHVLTSKKAKEDFEGEVSLISNIHHRNVIRLLGCSHKGSELLLVYEYMENGSLDKFLYGNLTLAYNETLLVNTLKAVLISVPIWQVKSRGLLPGNNVLRLFLA